MSPFEITILGCGSANPIGPHRQSSQLVVLGSHRFIIDCGEGMQSRLDGLGVSLERGIEAIFISHAHGDHVLGLPGLLSTMTMKRRQVPLRIFGPETLRPLLDFTLSFFCPDAPFPIHFTAVDPTRQALIFEQKDVEVWTLPLRHSTPCCGYLVRECRSPRHIVRQKIDELSIPHFRIAEIQNGADFTDAEGNLHPNAELTTPAAAPRSYAYVSDTAPLDVAPAILRDVTMLYHEATYGPAHTAQAAKYLHSSNVDAARFARLIGAKRLVLGHYSMMIKDEEAHLAQARDVFPATELADERRTFRL